MINNSVSHWYTIQSHIQTCLFKVVGETPAATAAADKTSTWEGRGTAGWPAAAAAAADSAAWPLATASNSAAAAAKSPA